MSQQKPQSPEQVNEKLLVQYNELAELAGSLAHEIKNPLSVILLNLELLSEDMEETESPQNRRALQKLKIVSSQCTRLENLLNDFLKFTRLRDLELTSGSVNDSVERVLSMFDPQAREAGVEIVRYLDPDLPSVRLDSTTLEAAILNLVKNALEAMPHGGQLTARTFVARGGVALDLIDTGCGIEEATALKMFTAFYSTKDGGSGLGLPTARKIIEAHGGRISVQSEVGLGTKFSLEFPMPVRITTEGK